MTFFSNFKWNGACDSLGGTVKQLTAHTRSYNDQLVTPYQLFDWACNNIPATYFMYCRNKDYVREQSSLEHCFSLSHTIPHMTKQHCLVPISDNTVEVKIYTSLDIFRKE